MAGAGSISPAEISGMSPVLVVGALLGQMKLTKPQCGQAVSLFGLSEAEKRLLTEVPVRSTPMPLTDPLIYRFRVRSEEHTSELQSLMRNSYAVFCLTQQITAEKHTTHHHTHK